MATVARDVSEAPRLPGGAAEPTPVIADRGGDARVIIVCLPVPPAVGDRFTFDGIRWEVVHTRDHVRGCVARPCLGAAQ
ncbi:MAG: hypothetical protein LAO05_10040 [Acidobacteriia bacterium]|nr:hypothetical protein [Terriglobia bacterium]